MAPSGPDKYSYFLLQLKESLKENTLLNLQNSFAKN
jgi:hypothetical protein